MAKLSGLTVARSSSVPLPRGSVSDPPHLPDQDALLGWPALASLCHRPNKLYQARQPTLLTSRPNLLCPHLPLHRVAAIFGYFTHRLSSFPSPSIPLLISFLGRGSSHFMTPDFFHPPWYRCGLCLWNTTLFIYLFWGVFPFFILNSRTQAQLWGRENLFIQHAYLHSSAKYGYLLFARRWGYGDAPDTVIAPGGLPGP